MRRRIAALLLVLVAFYLGSAAFDSCGECPGEETQVCHILCSDGCATAPIPTAPAAPAPDPLPRPAYQAATAPPPIRPHREPEPEPPRMTLA